MRKKGRHLKWYERLIIENMLIKKFKVKDIANVINCSVATIYNEKQRATYIYTDSNLQEHVRYCPDEAQRIYDRNLRKKGSLSKLEKDTRIRDMIEDLIKSKKYSPAACLMYLKRENLFNEVEIKSPNTIYRGIRTNKFDSLSLVDLPDREHRRKKSKVRIKKEPRKKEKSIETRPEEINDRNDFGHWEMDTVFGKKARGKVIVVLTERKTRAEIIGELKYCTPNEIRKFLNRTEKIFHSSFYRIFKTITCDNGVEFSNINCIEKALYRKGNRTKLYYCHPYTPSERGSNENQNKLIRRFFGKGKDFNKIVTKKKIKACQKWIMEYPRKLFDGKSSAEKLFAELKKIGLEKEYHKFIE